MELGCEWYLEISQQILDIIFGIQTSGRDHMGKDESTSTHLGISDNGNGLLSRGIVKKKDWSNGVLLVSKDPENLRDIAFRQYAILVK
ncbi:hypothetical protein AtNW77_Chr1g0041271 [Arabidopsis thaliana]|uniref:Spindle pole body component n=2 Tax=Arabidopsis TaxID=3701 RepID=F4I3A7_ARATH|nr:spindle pole body component [Arabidopsis thaliana]AEE31888.1 spindle pole body component [Arabidopsis thaliana]KAG7648616.1 hypothetical protein ISN45_At01g036170 [Arabidopsis thaliana x Arabidopsis arenosa]|eukprot:NP_174893.1 spindle pole body component [Arabidopsis thaliana]